MKCFTLILSSLLLISTTLAAPARSYYSSRSKCGSDYGKCKQGYCCSQYGHCGKSDDHCLISNGCQSEFGTCYKSKSTATKRRLTTTTSTGRFTTTPKASQSSCNWDNQYGNVDSDARPDAIYIWDFLMKKLGNQYGAAGMIGNLYAESRLRSNNLEGKYEEEFGMTDEEYTNGVDNNTYKNFKTDKAGYGLVQWTSQSRKTNFYEYAKKNGKKISDLQMQLDFLWSELQNEKYSNLLEILRSTNSVQEASDVVVLEFEIPKDRSQSVLDKRAQYGKMLMVACSCGQYEP